MAELPLPLMAAVGMTMTLLASTLVWMLAKPTDLALALAGSFLTAIVAVAEPSALVFTAVTVPGVPRAAEARCRLAEAALPPKPPCPPCPPCPKGAALALLRGKGAPLWRAGPRG